MQTLSYTAENKERVLTALRRPACDWAGYRKAVRPIIDAVRREGDRALRRFTSQFDGVDPDVIRVASGEPQRALAALPGELRSALEFAAENIRRFHELEIAKVVKGVETRPGVVCRSEYRPIPSVGLYVPGGSAPLVSTVLMLVIPAQLAGVGRIALCTPPGRDGKVPEPILAACALLGIEEIYAVGGAQAVAALAYGTESIEKVAKIAGPGNVYVSAAKTEVSIDPEGAAIDMLAGPSELLLIADETARPELLAADMLSQAEHDPQSQVVLLTTCPELPEAVKKCLAEQLESLPRREIAASALDGSAAVVVASLADAVELANRYAPEHLIVQTKNPEAIASRIQNAGSIFLGPFAPESVGDYCSGTNHVLPTSATARVQGGVNVRTFQKRITVQSLTREGLELLAPAITTLARAEGMEAHARAVEIRLPSPSGRGAGGEGVTSVDFYCHPDS